MSTLRRIKAAAGGAAAGAAAARGKKGVTATTTPANPEPPKRDLNNPAEQEKILRPEPTQLTIGGEPITLHPLPAFLQRNFAGLCGQIIASCVGKPGDFMMRVKAVLAEDAELSRKFFSYVARATYTPDFVVDQTIATAINAETTRMYDVATYIELGDAYDRMTLVNNVLEAFTRPK